MLNMGNGYAYIGNNPLNGVDPFGLADCPEDECPNGPPPCPLEGEGAGDCWAKFCSEDPDNEWCGGEMVEPAPAPPSWGGGGATPGVDVSILADTDTLASAVV